MDNIEQFSIYTAKILELLYKNFPVPTDLDRHSIIHDYLAFDRHDDLKKLDIQMGIISIAEHSYSEDGATRKMDKEKVNKVKEEYNKVKYEKDQDEFNQSQIYLGTISFLIDENLIRTHEEGGYRLTSKSFSHLNKSFKDGKLENSESSYISAIKSIFSTTTESSKDIAVGVAVNIIPKLLGQS